MSNAEIGGIIFVGILFVCALAFGFVGWIHAKVEADTYRVTPDGESEELRDGEWINVRDLHTHG